MWLRNFLAYINLRLRHKGTELVTIVPERYWHNNDFMYLFGTERMYPDLLIKQLIEWLKDNIEGSMLVYPAYDRIRIVFSRPTDAVLTRLTCPLCE